MSSVTADLAGSHADSPLSASRCSALPSVGAGRHVTRFLRKSGTRGSETAACAVGAWIVVSRKEGFPMLKWRLISAAVILSGLLLLLHLDFHYPLGTAGLWLHASGAAGVRHDGA